VIVTDASRSTTLFGVTPRGVVYTVTTRLPFSGPELCGPAPDNRTVWVGGYGLGSQANVVSVAPDGSITAVNTDLNHVFTGLDADGTGGIVFADLFRSSFPPIMKFTRAGFTTLLARGLTFPALRSAIELQSGDLVMLERGLLRCSLRGQPRLTTIVPNMLFNPSLISWPGLHSNPDTGTMILSAGACIYDVIPGSPGTVTTLLGPLPGGYVGNLDRDPFDGRFVIPAIGVNPGGGYPSRIYRFDARSLKLTTFVTFPATLPIRPQAVTVAGSRHLCGMGEARPGRMYVMLVSSPGQPGALYRLALSLGFRPGIKAGTTRTIHLNPDPLFHLSLTNGGIFYGFVGHLDPRGEALGAVSIPPLPALSGLRFFAAAITLVKNRISVISDPLGVTIQ